MNDTNYVAILSGLPKNFNADDMYSDLLGQVLNSRSDNCYSGTENCNVSSKLFTAYELNNFSEYALLLNVELQKLGIVNIETPKLEAIVKDSFQISQNPNQVLQNVVNGIAKEDSGIDKTKLFLYIMAGTGFLWLIKTHFGKSKRGKK